MGSRSFCLEFINNETSSYEGKKTLYQILKGNAPTLSDDKLQFLQCVRDVFSYVLSSVSEETIDYIINSNPYMDESSPNYDRSDILVFLVIISLLSGDSSYIIKNWYKNVDISSASAYELAMLSTFAGYDWLDTENSQVIEEQRSAILASFEILKYKGSFDSFISCIKNNVFNKSGNVNISKIKISENTDTLSGALCVVVSSPYTQFNLNGSINDANPHYVGMDIYQQALLDKLEELRPAGVFIYYTSVSNQLSQMNYWKHNYPSGLYPADSLRYGDGWTSIALHIVCTISDVTGAYTDVYSSYESLPITRLMFRTKYKLEPDVVYEYLSSDSVLENPSLNGFTVIASSVTHVVNKVYVTKSDDFASGTTREGLGLVKIN